MLPNLSSLALCPPVGADVELSAWTTVRAVDANIDVERTAGGQYMHITINGIIETYQVIGVDGTEYNKLIHARVITGNEDAPTEIVLKVFDHPNRHLWAPMQENLANRFEDTLTGASSGGFVEAEEAHYGKEAKLALYMARALVGFPLFREDKFFLRLSRTSGGDGGDDAVSVTGSMPGQAECEVDFNRPRYCMLMQRPHSSGVYLVESVQNLRAMENRIREKIERQWGAGVYSFDHKLNNVLLWQENLYFTGFDPNFCYVPTRVKPFLPALYTKIAAFMYALSYADVQHRGGLFLNELLPLINMLMHTPMEVLSGRVGQQQVRSFDVLMDPTVEANLDACNELRLVHGYTISALRALDGPYNQEIIDAIERLYHPGEFLLPCLFAFCCAIYGTRCTVHVQNMAIDTKDDEDLLIARVIGTLQWQAGKDGYIEVVSMQKYDGVEGGVIVHLIIDDSLLIQTALHEHMTKGEARQPAPVEEGEGEADHDDMSDGAPWQAVEFMSNVVDWQCEPPAFSAVDNAETTDDILECRLFALEIFGPQPVAFHLPVEEGDEEGDEEDDEPSA